MCVIVFLAYISVCVQCPQEARRGYQIPGILATGSCEPLCAYWELNADLLEESAALENQDNQII